MFQSTLIKSPMNQISASQIQQVLLILINLKVQMRGLVQIQEIAMILAKLIYPQKLH